MGKAVLFPVTKPLVKNLLYSNENVPFKKLFSSIYYVYNRLWICSPLKVMRFSRTALSLVDYKSLEATKVRKTARVWKTARIIENYKTIECLEDHIVRKSARSGSPQESKKTSRSQKARTSRVWKTGRPQESRRRRKTSDNTALFPSTRGGEREKEKRATSLQSMLKWREDFNNLCDDSSSSHLHPWGLTTFLTTPLKQIGL